MRRVLLGLVLVLVGALAATAAFGHPPRAEAHPLGNFTIHHSTTIEISESGVTVLRVLEMAEIPAFQERDNVDSDRDGEVSDAEYNVWSTAKAAELRDNMTLAIDGREVSLDTAKYLLAFPEGDGGLYLLRFEVTYAGALPASWQDSEPAVTFEDHAYADKIGWREIIIRGGPGVDVVGSSLPTESPTKRLLAFPEDSLSSPRDDREASFSFRPGVGLAPEPAIDPDHERATRGNPDSALDRFSELISEEEMSVGFVVFALGAAMAFGAVHALSPGHGKTIVAAYLVGSRGTLWHAALLGLTVTATHTSSVYVMGFVTLYLSEFIVPEDLYPWMGVISGAIIVAMGLALFAGRLRASGLPGLVASWWRSLTAGRPELALAGEQGSLAVWPRHQHGDVWHDHLPLSAETLDHHHHGELSGGGHDYHQHDEEQHAHSAEPHSHGWGAPHSHLPPGADGEAVTWQRLLGLGIFGGMIPCPSAIVVMLSAIALHRVGFGLVLIVAFSFGLAVVLTGIGFAVVWAQRIPLLQKAMSRAEGSNGLLGLFVRVFPVAAAALVFTVGVALILRAAGDF
jgi:ABC-type nickel/cobalt efflux system permease component RcnA